MWCHNQTQSASSKACALLSVLLVPFLSLKRLISYFTSVKVTYITYNSKSIYISQGW